MKSAIIIQNFSERQIDFASGEFYENSALLQKNVRSLSTSDKISSSKFSLP
jgi:hypothetical protein